MASISPNKIRRGQRGIVITALVVGEGQRHLHERRRDTHTGNQPMRDGCRHKVPQFHHVGIHGRARQFAQVAETLTAPVTTGTNRLSLPMVITAAFRTAPGVFGQRMDGLIQRVADRDPETVAVHDRHHSMKLGPVIRVPLQNIVLPLVNHLVRQRPDNLLIRLILKQRNR